MVEKKETERERERRDTVVVIRRLTLVRERLCCSLSLSGRSPFSLSLFLGAQVERIGKKKKKYIKKKRIKLVPFVFLFFLALPAFDGGLFDVTGEPVFCSLPVSVDSVDSEDVDSDLLLFRATAASANAAAEAAVAAAAAFTLFFLAMMKLLMKGKQ